MKSRPLIVTHHSPDLDAIGSVWLLVKFDHQKYGQSKFAFVNPGDKIDLRQAEETGNQLHEVIHVDTGLGKFDHHQKERAKKNVCAATLVYDYLCQKYPDYKNDKALKYLVSFINEVDHFKEIDWPEASSTRYCFMIHELIRGLEMTHPHNDDQQLHFGMECLDYAYASLKDNIKAQEIINRKAIEFNIKEGKCIGLTSRNDATLKVGQKQGYLLVVRKDSKHGNIRIKVRPDAHMSLKPLHLKVLEVDKKADWFFHKSGKMLINGSSKTTNQKASQLSLEEVIELIQEIYSS